MDTSTLNSTLRDAITRATAHFQAKVKNLYYRSNPQAWAKDRIGYTMWSKQVEVCESVVKNKYTAVKSGHSVGKQLSLDTPLPTPTGWTTMGEVQQGDYVMDAQGLPTLVTFKSETQLRPTYRVAFSDGSGVIAGDEHQWAVLDLSRRTGRMKAGVKDWRDWWDATVVMTTEELFKSGTLTTAGQGRWRIPNARPLQLPKAELPIDPYLLGLWLADGTTAGGQITLGDTKLGCLAHLGEYKIQHFPEKGIYDVRVKGLSKLLRANNFLGDKHIPNIYMRASESQRRELLAGILDGDGFLMKAKGGADVGIDLCDERLAMHVYELLTSLGVRVNMSSGEAAYTKNGKRHVTGTRWRMNFTPESNPFRVRGQNWYGGNGHQSRHTQRTIMSIDPVEQVTSACIQVQNEHSLYLCGKAMIPTHNTAIAAVLAQWWADTHVGEEAIVVTTAPNFDQVKGILWEYIRKSPGWKNEDQDPPTPNLPGVVSEQAEWKDANRNYIGIGRKPAAGNMVSFQGRHYKYTLVIIDEAGGVDKELFDAVDAITTTDTCRIVAIGNPQDPNTHFGTIFLGKGGKGLKAWSKHTISVLDSPNFTGEPVPQIISDNLASPGFVEKIVDEYGDDSDIYKWKVLGEFPETSENSLFPMQLLYKCTENEIDPPNGGRRQLGVDLAMYGSDSSAAVLNVGGVLSILKVWRGASALESAQFIHNLCVDNEITDVCIDAGTFGVAVIENVQMLAIDQKYMVWSMVGNGATPDKRKWLNSRAMWHGHMKSEMLAGRIQLPSPVTSTHNQQLFDEMLSIQYKINETYKSLQIESKKDMKARGVKSPDISDAAMYATAPLNKTDPLAGYSPGDTFTVDPSELFDEWDVQGYVISPC